MSNGKSSWSWKDRLVAFGDFRCWCRYRFMAGMRRSHRRTNSSPFRDGFFRAVVLCSDLRLRPTASVFAGTVSILIHCALGATATGCGDSLVSPLAVGEEKVEFVVLARRGHPAFEISGGRTLDVSGHGGCLMTLRVGVRAESENEAAVAAAPGRWRIKGNDLSDSGWITVRAGEWSPRTIRVPDTAESLLVELRGHATGWLARPVFECPADNDTSRPNIILISLDTLRADRLGAYGNREGLSPGLDAIARESVWFENAFATYPNTLASHATMFTGLYPGEHGLRHADHLDNQLAPAHRPLALLLRDAGYATAAFTEDAYVGSEFGFGEGFDTYDDGEADLTADSFQGVARQTFAKAAAWLQRRSGRPYFLFLHTYEVHSPYAPNRLVVDRLARDKDAGLRAAWEEREANYRHDPITELAFNSGMERDLDAADLARIELLYDAEVVGLDRELSRFLDFAKGLPAFDDTLLVITADHGDEFGEHGYLGHGETLHAGALRVPMLFWSPRLLPVPRKVEQVVSLLDLAPTIAEFAGLPNAYAATSARSLASLARGEASADADGFAFSELRATMASCRPEERTSRFQACETDIWAVRKGPFTYVRNEEQDRLYDRRTDPGETIDISERNPAELDGLRSLGARIRGAMTDRAVRRDDPGIGSETEERLRSLGYTE